MRTTRWWCAGLFAVGLLLRWIHLLTVRDSPFFRHLVLDSKMYDEWGRRIAAGEWLGDAAFFQDPLYPYMLGVIYRVVGEHYTPVILLQLLLGACVAPLLLLAALPWVDRRAAILAGCIAAIYAPSIYYEGIILKTWLAMFLVAVALYAFSLALQHGGRARWLAAGFTIGLACLARGNLVLMLPAVASWLILESPSGRRQRWAAPLALLLGGSLVLGVTAIRNRVVEGEWILVTSNAGQNFYIGNNPLNQKGQYGILPFVDANPKYEQRDFRREAERRTGGQLSSTAVSRFWFGEAARWIKENPSSWSRLTWRKIRTFWGAYEVPDNVDYGLYRATAPVLRLPLPGFGLVAPFGLLGAGLVLSRRGWPRLLLLFVAVYFTSVVIFFVLSRFRMPMMPAVFVLAAAAGVELVDRIRDRRAYVWPLVGLLIAFAFVNLPVRATPDRWNYRLAHAVGLPTLAEDSSIGHYNLGVAYAAQGRLELAEVELRLALEQESEFARNFVELGKVLARQGRNDDAIELYRQAVEREPGHYRAYHALGLLYRRIEDRASAEQAFRRALEIQPRHGISAVELGEVLLESGRREEAAEAFRFALRSRPNDRRARAGLARAD